MNTAELPLKLLKEYFGYDTFRGQQQDIIKRTLEGHDSLVIMPTGAGKSICYQLPALMLKGTVIVVSPLIALMQDQVAALTTAGIAAAALHSNQNDTATKEILNNFKDGTLKLLYVSPEKAVSKYFQEQIDLQKISLIAIDEAHCVSVWGNDFRPEYTELVHLINKSNVPHIALTATADKATRQDIAQKLGLKSAKTFLSSFERTNININVQPGQNRIETIIDYVGAHAGDSGIIYCLSKKSTEKIAKKLQEKGIKSGFYHAGMSGESRQKVQQAFQSDELTVICATIAFGMGIDKSNIRYVIHYNLPKNIESYYQEIGRSGRDGNAASTLLFFSLGDAKILRQFIDQSTASEDFKMIQRTKLNRMIEFGQASSCRTNFILSYFGEHRRTSCGHCDNCLHPPKFFDGTIIAQKALSAAKRLNEGVAINALVDILRGSQSSEIRRKGYDQIKTFGSITDLKREDLIQFIGQLINQGYFEIDFTHYNKLSITQLGSDVLYKDATVSLTAPIDREQKTPAKTKKEHYETGLFEVLKALRLKLAKEANLPAYAIFNDNTLKEMSRVKPLFEKDLLDISGVGKHKISHYGAYFLEAIRAFNQKKIVPLSVRGETYLKTLSMIQTDRSVAQIANQRSLSENTIYDHINHLYLNNEPINISQFVSSDEINKITSTWYKLKKTEEIKLLFQALNEKINYGKIKLALSFIKKS
jgi:ATP-dependent DNA helicase RecQ